MVLSILYEVEIVQIEWNQIKSKKRQQELREESKTVYPSPITLALFCSAELPNTDVNLNVFVKQNEQSSNLFENSAMARKGRQSQLFHRDDIYCCKVKKKNMKLRKDPLDFLLKRQKKQNIGENEACQFSFFPKNVRVRIKKSFFIFTFFTFTRIR